MAATELSEDLIELDSDDDIEVVEDVVEYLDNEYAEPMNQGPVHITGSSVYGSDPNDYDLVVQRQAEDEREFRRGRRRPTPKPNAVPADEDYRVMASMMRDLSDDSTFSDYDENTTVDKTKFLLFDSDRTRADAIGQNHNPQNRFQVEIQDVDIDVTFTPSEPIKDFYQLTEGHGRL